MMTEATQGRDLAERVQLIESMLLEGRRTTESWGWTFVLWGVAYYVAILWSALGHSPLAWPVTMTATMALMGILLWRKAGSRPGTTIGRALASVWIAVGISMFLLFLSLGVSGRSDEHIFIAVIGAMLGAANAASGLILKWKLQFACALVWWATAVFACFGRSEQLTLVFLAAIFFCQIVFGIYGMIAESRKRGQGLSHA